VDAADAVLLVVVGFFTVDADNDNVQSWSVDDRFN